MQEPGPSHRKGDGFGVYWNPPPASATPGSSLTFSLCIFNIDPLRRQTLAQQLIFSLKLAPVRLRLCMLRGQIVKSGLPGPKCFSMTSGSDCDGL